MMMRRSGLRKGCVCVWGCFYYRRFEGLVFSFIILSMHSKAGASDYFSFFSSVSSSIAGGRDAPP